MVEVITFMNAYDIFPKGTLNFLNFSKGASYFDFYQRSKGHT